MRSIICMLEQVVWMALGNGCSGKRYSLNGRGRVLQLFSGFMGSVSHPKFLIRVFEVERKGFFRCECL